MVVQTVTEATKCHGNKICKRFASHNPFRRLLCINRTLCHTLHQSTFSSQLDNMSENEYDTTSDDNSVSNDYDNAMSNADSSMDANEEYQIDPWWPLKKRHHNETVTNTQTFADEEA